MGGSFFACKLPRSRLLYVPLLSPVRFFSVRTLFVVVGCALALFGCSHTQDRSDLDVYLRSLHGKATYKETRLCLERTSHALLVEQEAYLVKDFVSRGSQTRPVREGESVRDVIAEIHGQARESAGVFFLVRGIGEKTEMILYGEATQPAAGNLRPVAGDLLVINPSPAHPLFEEYKGTR
jgi:hypothetical protein